MENIGKITARLEADAQREIEAINAEAAEKIAAIKAEYDKKAQEAYWEAVEKGTRECEARAKRLAGTADMEARKSILTFKQEMVAEAFESAVKAVSELPKEEYVAFLASQSAKAAEFGTEELIFNAKDRQEVGADAAKKANEMLKAKGIEGKLTVSEETRDIPGGVIVRQGNIESNCSVDVIAQLYRNELSSQVAEILFA